MKNIVILISGGGSNMAAIVKTAKSQDWASHLDAQVAAVISNRPDAAGLAWAKIQNIPTASVDHRQFTSREAFDQALCAEIDKHVPALVVLAGFMRILTPTFVAHYSQRLINIHPSLLPAFTGLHTHQRAIEAGCKFAGATVHRVTAELDVGPILGQAIVPILPTDSVADLSARVLTQEHILYPNIIAKILKEKP